MAKSFTPAQWTRVEALADAEGADFGLPARRADSVVLASFNIRKIGQIKNKSPGAWAFLKRFCERCDLIAVQEVQNNLEALIHLKGLLGPKYGLAVSDVTGGIAGKQAMVERLAFLFRWDRIERTEVASDITIDRSAVLDTLYGERDDFEAAFKARVAEMKAWKKKVNKILAPWKLAVAAWQAAGRPGKKPRKPKTPGKPPFVLPHFLTFIRTPHCASFRVGGGAGAEPLEFIAVNAHLLYGDKSKQADERKREFSGLLKWLIERARKAKTMYHKNIILLGDLNLDFKKVDARRDAIEAEIKRINDRDLKRRAKIYFPFIDVHPGRAEVFRSNARHSQSYDQIAIVSNDARLPRPADGKKAGTVAGGFDFGMFDFVNLFAEALHGKPFKQLTGPRKTALIARFQHDVSDHMPIWIRLAKPS